MLQRWSTSVAAPRINRYVINKPDILMMKTFINEVIFQQWSSGQNTDGQWKPVRQGYVILI